MNLRASLAKDFLSRGLVEFVDVDELEDEDEGEVETDGETDGEEAPGRPAWSEPDLGRFEFDDFGWVAHVAAPEFKAFKYGARRGKPAGKYVLRFVADTADEVPTPAAVALAKRVLANAAALVPKVVEALWADFTGSGPESGMYWHGDLDQVAEGLETGEPPKGAQDLFKLMGLGEIQVRSDASPSVPAQAELNFQAAFEEEHGVGILTDGTKITGIGYSGGASAFEPARQR